MFGSFLCPLCGKTYKYEYNLFYHWRRTCRDLNELLQIDERKIMDVNNLRQLVDDVAQKKAEVTPMEIGISARILYGHSPFAKLEMPSAGPARRGQACRACGVVVLAPHMERHIAIHKGLASVDERSVSGGFFCDLCGLMFRQHFNLIKHWRTSCPEIQANLPEDIELTMDDDGLRRMVSDLLKRSVTGELDDESTLIASADADAIASKHVNRLAQKSKGTISHVTYSFCMLKPRRNCPRPIPSSSRCDHVVTRTWTRYPQSHDFVTLCRDRRGRGRQRSWRDRATPIGRRGREWRSG